MSPLAYRHFRALMGRLMTESKDGQGSADHDQPYHYELRERLTAKWHWPLTDLQFVRMMLLRSRVRDGLLRGDTWPDKEDE